MKPTIYITAIFLLIFGVGCNIPPTHTEWTEATKEQAKKEISARIDEIIQGANNLGVEAAIQPYANTPEFLMVNPDATISMVDVRDVAEAIFQAATTKGIHGKNYIIANESYKVSNISLMLNKREPLNEAAIGYDSSLAKNDLGIAFIASKETLNHCV